MIGLQHLEQRQHVLTGGGGEKIIGVLDARGDAAQGNEFAQIVLAQQRSGVGGGNGSEYGHWTVVKKRGPGPRSATGQAAPQF